MRILFLFFFTYSVNILLAQSSRIESVNLFQQSGYKVLVQWIISPGSSCNAPQIQWSEDGINFKTIYTYPGVCEATTEPTPYSWVHAGAKPFAVNHYRVKVDEGEISLPQSIDLQSQLAEESVLIYPNPAKDFIWVELRNPDLSKLEIEICESSGKVIFKKSENPTIKFQIRTKGLSAGIYFLKLKYDTDEELVKMFEIR